MANILTAAEAATVLRCEEADQNMLDLLPLVDDYIQGATGRDWAADSTISPKAKAAARMLLVQWHENPAMIGGDDGPLHFGLSAVLSQLEALARRYVTFEGVSGAGSICLPGVHEGDTVVSVTGKVGVSGDQAALFETVISCDHLIKQLSAEDHDDHWFTAYIVPPEAA